MYRNKAIVFATILAWFLVLGFLFGPVRWEVSWTYSHWFGFSGIDTPVFGMDLPYPTIWFSLPVLGLEVTRLGFWNTILFYAYWGFLWIYPLILAINILRTTDKQYVLTTWVFGASLYLVLITLLFILVAFGMWAPFMHF